MKKGISIVLLLFAVAIVFTHTQAAEESEQAGATVISVVNGTATSVAGEPFTAAKACTSCGGSGNGPFNCFHCSGSGRLNGFRCNFCNGKGFAKCTTCNGTGQTR